MYLGRNTYMTNEIISYMRETVKWIERFLLHGFCADNKPFGRTLPCIFRIPERWNI